MYMKLPGSSSSLLPDPLPPQPTTMVPLHWFYREILEPPCMKPPWLTLHLLNNHLKNPKMQRSDGKDISWTFTMMNSKMMKETQVTDWLQVLVPTKWGARDWELPSTLKEDLTLITCFRGGLQTATLSSYVCDFGKLILCSSAPGALYFSQLYFPAYKKRNLSHGWCEN